MEINFLLLSFCETVSTFVFKVIHFALYFDSLLQIIIY